MLLSSPWPKNSSLPNYCKYNTHQPAVWCPAPSRSVVMHLLYVLSMVSLTFGADLQLTILHNNDMHGRFEETSRNSGTCRNASSGCIGGFARTAHEIRRFRQAKKEVLYLNAGDTYVGTAWFSVHKWRICSQFLNLLKPDAMVRELI